MVHSVVPAGRFLLLGGLSLLMMAGSAADARASSFVAFKPDTFCCGGSSRIRLDWSSDFGADWLMTTDSLDSPVMTSFPATPGPSWPLGFADADRSVELALSRQVSGVAMDAHGLIQIAAAGPASSFVVHRIQQSSGMSGGSSLYGFSAETLMGGDFFFDGVSVATPLYWGVEWDLTILTPVEALDRGPSGGAELRVNDLSVFVFPQATLVSQTISGGSFGATTSDRFRVSGLSNAFSGRDGAGEILLDVRIAFSDTPFSDIPDAAPVPEPGTWALLGTGLVLMVRHRRNRVAPGSGRSSTAGSLRQT